jgi:ssDNA-binding Zn-finger/Zn-ribbon topoisomerase 1
MTDLDETFGRSPNWPPVAPSDGRPYDRTDCPYCGVELHPLPKAKKRCPSCGEPIYVRAGPDNFRHLLRTNDLGAIDAQWEAHWRARIR